MFTFRVKYRKGTSFAKSFWSSLTSEAKETTANAVTVPYTVDVDSSKCLTLTPKGGKTTRILVKATRVFINRNSSKIVEMLDDKSLGLASTSDLTLTPVGLPKTLGVTNCYDNQKTRKCYFQLDKFSLTINYHYNVMFGMGYSDSYTQTIGKKYQALDADAFADVIRSLSGHNIERLKNGTFSGSKTKTISFSDDGVDGTVSLEFVAVN